VRHKPKRAITEAEHRRIVARERNPEWNAFYQVCWHFGGAQTDMATLCAADIDWESGTLSFSRKKTAVPVVIALSPEVKDLLKTLPCSGNLFPKLAELHEKHRARLFRRRCDGLGITGITLHSYRYAWAERAKVAGYPERFAQLALGHNSQAVHRAYAKNAQVTLPPLEEYERERARKIVPIISGPTLKSASKHPSVR
jgi:integrase